jgi:hypothetical protein
MQGTKGVRKGRMEMRELLMWRKARKEGDRNDNRSKFYLG